MGTNGKLEWCLEKGKLGAKHKGVRRIEPSITEGRKHIEKALHNLRAMEYNIRGGFSDWAISAAFYAMYHSLLALLYKHGFESRNQECTITVIEHLIEQKKINFKKEYISIIRGAEEVAAKDAKSTREEFQYGTKTEAEKEILEAIRKNAKEFVEAARNAFETDIKT